jgi:hypothetical protein
LAHEIIEKLKIIFILSIRFLFDVKKLVLNEGEKKTMKVIKIEKFLIK